MSYETETSRATTQGNLLETLTNLKGRQRIKIETELGLSISTGNLMAQILKHESGIKVIYFFMTKKIREIDFMNMLYEKFNYPRKWELPKKDYAKIIATHSHLYNKENEIVIFDNYGTVNQYLTQVVQKFAHEIPNPTAFIFRKSSEHKSKLKNRAP